MTTMELEADRLENDCSVTVSTAAGDGRPGSAGLAVTSVLVAVPLIGLAGGIVWLALGNRVSWLDLVLGASLYLVSGYGVTVGYHRLFTHRSFRAAPWLRVALAVAGSMALEGGVVSWVANHRLHHRHSDRAGDPHSPYRYGTSGWALARGMVWSHVAWLFRAPAADAERYAHDLRVDPAIGAVDRLFPLIAVASLGLPFGIAWVATDSLSAAGWALLWAGAVRVTVLHHVTWSINSLCHVLGRRPNATSDRSSNLAILAVVSLGESWHNNHHAFPSCARHGIGRHQFDPSARLIRLLESAGFARLVRWDATPRAAVAAATATPPWTRVGG